MKSFDVIVIGGGHAGVEAASTPAWPPPITITSKDFIKITY